MRRFSYTLMEILVVVAIIALAAGLLLPRFGHLPAGLQRRQNESTILDAFRDASARARAAGVTVQLQLDEAGERLVLGPVATAAVATRPNSAATGVPSAGDTRDVSFLPEMTYPLPNGVSWVSLQSSKRRGEDEAAPRFRFHPNGEADGPPVQITIGNDRWRLDVDRLTGRPHLREEP